MKTKITIGIGLLFILLHFSCDEIFEEELEDKEVITISPPDGYVSENQNITFWWDYVAGADSYQIQIVSPSFDFVEVLEFDTLVGENKFSANFYPGEYEWSIRALNSASETAFSYPLRFSIDSSIVTGAIEMLLPLNNAAFSELPIEFKWNDPEDTGEYLFRIYIEDSVIYSKSVYQQSYTLDSANLGFKLLDEKYNWNIQSVKNNQLSEELLSYFYIDNTAPALVGVTAPANSDTLPSPIEFKWNKLIDKGTPVTYHLVVATDSLFSESDFYFVEGELNYKLDMDTGTYFWKIYASDEAGNTGTSDSYYKITVIELPEEEVQDE